MKRLVTVTVDHEGWVLFCPVWMAEAHSASPMPIPKYGLWWLFEAAMELQQFRNRALSFFLPEECLGFLFRVKPCAPREVSFMADWAGND